MKISNISQMKLFGVASVFTLTAIATPLIAVSSASAAAIPKSQKYADINDCKAKVGKHTSAEIDTYFNDRYNNRATTLKSLDKKIDSQTAASAKKVSAAEAVYKKNQGKASGINANYLDSSKSFLKGKVNEAQNGLNGLKTTEEAVKSSSAKAEATCNMLYGLRVNSYVKPLVAWMYQIDAKRARNTANQIRVADTKAVYEKRKAKYVTASAASSIVSKLPNPDELSAELNKAAERTRSLTIKEINAEDPPKAYDQFKAQVPGALDVFNKVGTQTGQISNARKDLAKQKLKKASSTKKKSSTTKSSGVTSGGQSLGGGSSTGGTAAPNN